MEDHSATPSATVLVSVDVEYHGVKGLPELPVFGMRFIMPTLADSYMYEGLSEKPIRTGKQAL